MTHESFMLTTAFINKYVRVKQRDEAFKSLMTLIERASVSAIVEDRRMNSESTVRGKVEAGEERNV